MYTTLQFIHSWWAYLVLFMLVIAAINAISGVVGNREYQPRDFRIALFTLIVTHIQLLIGLILFFTSQNYGLKSIMDYGMGGVMDDANLRLYAVEHPTIMILVVILVTFGYSRHKKKLVSKRKFNTLALFYTLAAIFALSRIPWQQWLNL